MATPTRSAASLVRPAETFHMASHAAGAALAAVGLVVLLARADSPRSVAAFGIYGASLVTLFLASALHHAAEREGRPRGQRFDHIAIYLTIAGSYTPPCVLLLPPRWGLPLLGVVWLAALVGIALKIYLPVRTAWVSAGPYLVLGWAALVAAPALLEAVPTPGLLLLAGGGVVYSLGAVVYATGRPDPWPQRIGAHGLWHVLVLAAGALHFAFMATYVPAA